MSHFPAADEKREVVLAIEDKVKVLERMTHDFIGFSRTYQPRLQPEDIHELVNDVLIGHPRPHRFTESRNKKAL
jgi:nitrogen fixation/metabolism regulation signal transduction histidine kinase